MLAILAQNYQAQFDKLKMRRWILVDKRAPEHLARPLVVFSDKEISAKFNEFFQAQLAVVVIIYQGERS